MATKSILRQSIETLEKTNESLLIKLKNCKDDSRKDEINNEIIRNQSIILDYKFRLEQDG